MIATNNSRGTATSASGNMMYGARRTTFVFVLISLSRSVVNDQCFTHLGNARRRRKCPRLDVERCQTLTGVRMILGQAYRGRT